MRLRVLWLAVLVALQLARPLESAGGDADGGSGAGVARPTHSIIFVTKRPGGYDVLFEAFARQTSKDYELICVDELAPRRAHNVRAMAAALGVNLAAVTPSKPKTHPHTRFGIANAFNTGFVLARGAFVTILQDNIYVPADFVEKSIAFHRDHPRALLSYPELRFSAPEGLVNSSRLTDPGAISVFDVPVTAGPRDQEWRAVNEGTMPRALWDNMLARARVEFDWLECACCSVPYAAVRELNGVDETLDVGDDCHEVNLKQKSQMLGYEVWSEGAAPVQLIDHHRWARSDLWTRFTRDTNIFRWDFMKQQMDFGEYPLRAPNNFNLFLFPPSEAGNSGAEPFDLEDAPKVVILTPTRGAVLRSPVTEVRFEVRPKGALVGGARVCISVAALNSVCVKDEVAVEVAVHRAGAHILHVMLYDADFRLIAEAQTAFVQEVPAATGELGRLGPAEDASYGWLQGEAASVRSGLEGDAIQEVFRKEHDDPKEALLFVFNKDPAHVDTWRDGLWAAVRLLARNYTIQYLNVNDIIVDQQPDIGYHIRAGAYKIILGWGAFGSPTDYFLREIHLKHGDTHPKALCIGGNAVPPPSDAADIYDMLFFETEWYRETLAFHPRARQAFGINTNIYHELPPRVDADGNRAYEYDVLMVGHFLPWKRHMYLATMEGRRLAVGEIYQEYEVSSKIVAELQNHGIEVSNMLPPRELAALYRASRTVVFPMATIGGGERALLEARACGARVHVAEDNPKLQSLLALAPIPDHVTYARQLLEGIGEVLEARGTRNATTRPAMPSDETVVEQRIRELIRNTCTPGAYCPYQVKHEI